MQSKIDKSANSITFSLNANVYPKEIIYTTCYVFIDRMYIYLDNPKKNLIVASLKGKDKLKQKELENLKGEFLNELLNVKLREDISKRNKKVLEYIVGGAVNASLEKNDQSKKEEDEKNLDIEKEIALLKKELDEMESEDYEKDSLGVRNIISTGDKTKKIKEKKK